MLYYFVKYDENEVRTENTSLHCYYTIFSLHTIKYIRYNKHLIIKLIDS